MEREEAIKLLKYPIHKWSMDWDDREDGLCYTEAIEVAISALTPPTQEQLERVWGAEWIECEEYDKCSKCGYLASKFWRGDFCPGCNRAMTPEALKIVRERWSAVIEGGV